MKIDVFVKEKLVFFSFVYTSKNNDISLVYYFSMYNSFLTFFRIRIIFVFFCRFAGEEFPPFVLFKVFIQTNGKGVKYLCGKKIIKPASLVSLTDLTECRPKNLT